MLERTSPDSSYNKWQTGLQGIFTSCYLWNSGFWCLVFEHLFMNFVWNQNESSEVFDHRYSTAGLMCEESER